MLQSTPYRRQGNWRGQLDDVAIYSRALSATEAAEQYKRSAAGYGVDTGGFDRLRLSVWPLPEARRLSVLCDCSGVFVRADDARVELSVTDAAGAVVALSEITPLPHSGLASAEIDLPELAPGQCTDADAVVVATGAKVLRPVIAGSESAHVYDASAVRGWWLTAVRQRAMTK